MTSPCTCMLFGNCSGGSTDKSKQLQTIQVKN